MGHTADEEVILTLGAAQILECSQDRVRQLERAGKLRARRTSSGVRLFSRAEVERFALARKRGRISE
jgi:DNA-binding transcriptional MerR regulator